MPTNEPANDQHASETIEVDGAELKLYFEKMYSVFWRVTAVMSEAVFRQLPDDGHLVFKAGEGLYLLDGMAQILRLWPSKFVTDDVQSVYNIDTYIVVVDEEGETIASGQALWLVVDLMKTADDIARREALQARYQERLALLEETAESLRCRDLPIYTLNIMLRQASRHVRNLYIGGSAPHGSSSIETIETEIRAIEREINRLEGDIIDVLVHELVSGNRYSHIKSCNQRVIDLVGHFSIRSGGFIEPITPEMLESFYRTRLESATGLADIARVGEKALIMSVEDYAPGDILDDIGLAPSQVKITSRNEAVTYAVEYSRQIIDGAEVPVGSVTLPLRVYKLHQKEHGRKSTLPVLPHGITLVITVTVDGNEIAKGTDGEALQAKIRKYRGAKHRSGLANHNYVPSEPPPWAAGQAARSRWR